MKRQIRDPPTLFGLYSDLSDGPFNPANGVPAIWRLTTELLGLLLVTKGGARDTPVDAALAGQAVNPGAQPYWDVLDRRCFDLRTNGLSPWHAELD